MTVRVKIKVSTHGVPSLEDPPFDPEISFSVALLWVVVAQGGQPEVLHADAV